MTSKYPAIAAAVAAAMAAGYAHAQAPSLATLQANLSTAPSLVIAGSSAAQSSIANAVEVDLCGGASNTTIITSTGDTNFNVYACDTSVSAGSISAGTLVIIYYRSEGGSVVGALPMITNPSTGSQPKIQRIALNDCTTGPPITCSITGTTSSNGMNDSWTGAVAKDYVQLGVTDVEPRQLVNGDYPTNYSTTLFGTQAYNQTQLPTLSTVRAVQQVFGFGVNPGNITLNGANNGQINLTNESIANILLLNYSDWSAVPDALTGEPISTASAPITRIDREPGSGTRTSTNIYFLNYQCGSTIGITTQMGEQLNYATGDELKQANSTPGAIAYASIDNLNEPKNTSYTNLVLATINGVTPSTLAAAAGEYSFWFEATLVPNPTLTSGSSYDLSQYLQSKVPEYGSAPIAADINVIPNIAGNGPGTVPLTGRSGDIGSSTWTAEIYLNPYTRNGSSCNVPSETN